MPIAGYEKADIEKFILDGSQYKTELSTIAKELRKSAKVAKDTEMAQKHLAGQMTKVEASTKGSSLAMAKGTVAANVIMGAFHRLSRGIGSVIKAGLTWNDWIGDNTFAVDGMSKAIAGMVDKMELSQIASKLQSDEFGASQKQLESLAKAAVHFSRVNRKDLAPSIKAIADAIVAGAPTGIFRKLGVDVQFTGTQSERTAKALELLEERFGDMKVEATNANEQIGQMKSGMADAAGELGHAIIKTDAMKWALDGLTDILKDATQAFKDLDKAIPTGGGRSGAFIDFAMTPGRLDTLIASGNADRAAAKKAAETPSRKKGKRGPDNIPLGQEMPAIAAKRASEEEAFEASLAAGEVMTRQIALQEEMNILLVEEQAHRMDLIDAKERENAIWKETYDKTTKYHQSIREMDDSLNGIASGALNDLTTGMIAAGFSAMEMGEGFGTAMAGMVKATLLGVAQESAVLALKYTGLGFAALIPSLGIPNPGSVAAFTAAGIFTGLAAGTAAGGLGIASAMSGGGGGGGAAASSSADYRPSSAGQDSEDRVFEPTINIYLTDGNAALGTHLRKELLIEMDRAA